MEIFYIYTKTINLIYHHPPLWLTYRKYVFMMHTTTFNNKTYTGCARNTLYSSSERGLGPRNI